MAEQLSATIAREYQDRATRLPDNGLQDIGDRRKLRIELQNRCGLTELEAINILNGHHVGIYIAKYERRALLDEFRKQNGNQDTGRMAPVRGRKQGRKLG